MLLTNVKRVRIGSAVFDVKYTENVNLLEGNNLANISHSGGTIHIKANQVEWMKSLNLWHEIIHAFSYLCKVIETPKDGDVYVEMNEREISRLAKGLNDLEIEYHEPETKGESDGA